MSEYTRNLSLYKSLPQCSWKSDSGYQQQYIYRFVWGAPFDSLIVSSASLIV